MGNSSNGMLPVGTILHGTYRIDAYLASGGFGNTYLATNVAFNEKCAIKEFFLRGIAQRDSDNTTVSVSNVDGEATFKSQREKFKKEAVRLRKLHSEHIVGVHDLFDENNTTYYVMDYIDGVSLKERLKQLGHGLPESEVLDILRQVLDALSVAHSENILHLDLKPANIMLDKNGTVKLIDFGASKQEKATGGATTTSAISYTNGYAPREQMEQNLDKFGPWTDLYALGATVYTLLTNKKPPLPSDIDEDLSADKHEALLMPSVSTATKKLVIWLMSTNRTQRPQSVEEVLVHLPQTVNTSAESYNTSNSGVSDDDSTIIAPAFANFSELKKDKKGKKVPVYRSIKANGLTWILISIELRKKSTVLKFRVYSEEDYSYIYDSGNEYITVCSSGNIYNLLQVEGIVNESSPTFLLKKKHAVEFTEYYEPLRVNTKTIDCYLNDDLVIKNISLSGDNEEAEAAKQQTKIKANSIPLQKGLSFSEVNKLANENNVDALLMLAEYYLYGSRPDKNTEQGLDYLRRAVETGSDAAKVYLGGCYLTGVGVKKNYSEAFKWFKKSAEQENSDAQYMLGECYYHGRRVAQNYSEAVEWYKKSAEQENSKAQYMLGKCYYYGRGIAQNYSEAVKWYKKAAAQGDSDGELALGICYYYGYGVNKNYAKASDLFRKSAEQGNNEAKKVLVTVQRIPIENLKNEFKSSRQNSSEPHVKQPSKPIVSQIADKVPKNSR